MPPKKRTASNASNAEPPSKAKRSGGQSAHHVENDESHNTEAAAQSNEHEHAYDHEATSEGHDHSLPPPELYICTPRLDWDQVNADHGHDDDDHHSDEDREVELEGTELFKKPAAEHPSWQWVMMWKSWTILAEWQRRVDYCNPDNFDMWIYNDFYGYGLQELIENLLVEINKELSKKRPSLQPMWAAMAGLLHWLLNARALWMDHDDGDRTAETTEMIGYAFLSCLNELDRADSLTADSEFRDLGLLMMVFMRYMDGFSDSVEKPSLDSGERRDDLEAPYGDQKLTFERKVVAYARKAGIDLKTTPLCDGKKLLKDVGDIGPLEGEAKPDRWAWSQKYKDFEAKHGTSAGRGGKPKIGGQLFDITKFTRGERAKHNFDKKDPLAGIPIKDLKENNIMVA